MLLKKKKRWGETTVMGNVGEEDTVGGFLWTLIVRKNKSTFVFQCTSRTIAHFKQTDLLINMSRHMQTLVCVKLVPSHSYLPESAKSETEKFTTYSRPTIVESKRIHILRCLCHYFITLRGDTV